MWPNLVQSLFLNSHQFVVLGSHMLLTTLGLGRSLILAVVLSCALLGAGSVSDTLLGQSGYLDPINSLPRLLRHILTEATWLSELWFPRYTPQEQRGSKAMNRLC